MDHGPWHFSADGATSQENSSIIYLDERVLGGMNEVMKRKTESESGV
jgi:hypothetical protein